MMHYSKGGMNMEMIMRLPFNHYTLALDEALRIQKLEEKALSNDG